MSSEAELNHLSEIMMVVAKMHAANARIEAMKALNHERAANGYALGYDEGAFHAEAVELEGCAERLRLIGGLQA